MKEISEKDSNHPVGHQKVPPVSKGKVKFVGTTAPIKGGTGTAYQNPT